MRARAVGGSEIEQLQTGIKFIGLGKISLLKMRFGDFELRRFGENLVMLGILRGKFQRGIDDIIKMREGELVGSEIGRESCRARV